VVLGSGLVLGGMLLGCCGLGFAAAVVAAPSARADAPAPTTITLSETPQPSGPPEANYQLIAALSPQQAIGAIVLLDNGHQVAAASNYQIRWSYATVGLSVGVHHFTVEFTPLANSGYTASQASIDYTVVGVTTSVSPTPTPTSTPTPRPTPTPTHSAQPTPTPTQTATAVPTAQPTGGASPSANGGGAGGSGGGGDGLLPFTGLNTIGMLVTSAVLILIGAAFIVASRGRRTRAN
jgi:hypothetical protein